VMTLVATWRPFAARGENQENQGELVAVDGRGSLFLARGAKERRKGKGG